MPSKIMQTVLLLAPWLATQTYACPWAIISTGVASVNVKRGVRLNVVRRSASSSTSTEQPQPLQPDIAPPLTKKPADFLLYKDDAWRSAQALTDPDAVISDARLLCALSPH